MIEKVFFDITSLCNANCLYCFTNSVNSLPSNNELTTSDIKTIIDKLVNFNVKSISIGGGEPFLRNDICEIIDYIDNRIDISITSNGSIMNEDIITRLKNSNIKLTISLDSINKYEFSKVRKGLNLDLILKNIDLLLKNKSIKDNISIRATITTSNLENLNNLYNLIYYCENNGIKKLKINSTNNFGRAKNNNYLIPDFNLFSDKLNNLCTFINSHNFNLNIILPIKKYLNTNSYQICSLGNSSLYINSIGDIFPCAFTEGAIKLDNILNDSSNRLFIPNEPFNHNNNFCNKCPIHRYDKNNTF